jgi:hypothetical protein
MFVLVGRKVGVVVAVATAGVAVGPMATGVGLNIAGVRVGSTNGVGGLTGKGCTPQPLQDVRATVDRINKTALFTLALYISSLLLYVIVSRLLCRAKSPVWFWKRVDGWGVCKSLSKRLLVQLQN